MSGYIIKGGANIGRTYSRNATLKINSEKLELTTEMNGNLVFLPSNIYQIELYNLSKISHSILKANGIQIHHNVNSYKEKVIFWTSENSESVFKKIKETGFLTNRDEQNSDLFEEIQTKQKNSGLPVKKDIVIRVVITWILLFLIGFISFYVGKPEGLPLIYGIIKTIKLFVLSTLITIILFLSISIAGLMSLNFRSLILKESRTFEDLKELTIITSMICGFIMFTYMLMLT